MTYTTFIGILLISYSLLTIFNFPPVISFQKKCRTWMKSDPEIKQKLDEIRRFQGNEKSQQAFEHAGHLLMLLAGIALILQGFFGK